MASRYNVAGQTDLTSTATWAASRFGSGGETVPTTGDDVFILNGDETLTGDLNTDTGNITIGGDFEGNVGTSGDATVIGCDGDVLIEGARIRNIYIGASTTHNVANMVINAPNARVTLTTDSGGDFTRVVVKQCASLKIEGIVVNLHYIGGRMLPIEYSSTAITDISAIGGRIECRRPITTANLDARAYLLTEQTASGAVTVGTANVRGGATFNHRSSGTVTTGNLYDGLITIAGSAEDFTITTLNRYGNSRQSRVVKDAGPVSITVGTDNDYGGAGFETSQTLDSPPTSL